MDRGGGVKLRALWLPVASDADVVSQDESSLFLLSLYVGKLMGAGKEGEELKLRVSTSLAVVESRLLRKMEKGWMVGEGMVVLVDKMEGKVVLEVVDVRRDKVLGEVEVDVAEESTAIVKRQWGNISEVGSCLFLPSSCLHFVPPLQEYLEICQKAFPLVPTEAQLLPETPDGLSMFYVNVPFFCNQVTFMELN